MVVLTVLFSSLMRAFTNSAKLSIVDGVLVVSSMIMVIPLYVSWLEVCWLQGCVLGYGIQVVSPPLQHRPTLIEIFGLMNVSAPHFASFLMSHVALDGVPLP